MQKLLPQSRRGSALVLTLAILSIVSVMLLSFLITAQLDGQSTANYSQNIRAQDLGLSALQEITDGVLREIASGSNAVTTEGVTIYTPKANLSAAPYRSGYAKSDYGILADGAKLPPTLIAVSRAGAKYPKDPYGANADDSEKLISQASDMGSETKSSNGRWISANRWNKPQILSGGTTVPSAFSANPPDWVYVTRSGSKVLTPANLAGGALFPDPKVANPNAVLGRYAYVIYDQGGMLDVTVAGFDATTKSTYPELVGGKSYLPYADLTVLPGIPNQGFVDTLIGWRNKGGLEQYTQYASLIPQAAKTGFTQFQLKDNPILTRQDLIEYFKNQPGGSTLAVPYLSTFTRAVNAPSWSPRTPTGSTVDYAARANVSDAENRNFPNVRDPNDHLPLLKKRFPLNRLALLTNTATASTSDPIYDYFGLTRGSASDSWTYSHGDPNNIMTLEDVAAANRQPDFFELLKAVILNGSLGKDPGGGDKPYAVVWGQQGNLDGTGPGGQFFGKQSTSAFTGYSSIPDLHIIQLGANIIDQFDADSYPTSVFIQVASNPAGFPAYLDRLFTTVHGIENLPYLYSLRVLRYRNPAEEAPNGMHYAWFQPALWNPHQTSTNSYTGDLRLQVYGKTKVSDWAGSGNGYTNAANVWVPLTAFGEPSVDYAVKTNYATILVNSANTFYDYPVWLHKGVASSDTANMWTSAHGNAVGEFVAFFAGKVKAAETYNTVANVKTHKGWGDGFIVGAADPITLTFALEYKDASGNWRPYSTMARYNMFDGHGWTAETQAAVGVLGNADLSRPDPRTDRFSVVMGWDGVASPGTTLGLGSYWPNVSTKRGAAGFIPKPNRGFTYPDKKIGMFADNFASSSARYTDYDSVPRPGDAYRVNGSDGSPAFTGTSSTDRAHARRPVILNRPFKSVGELGYAFRDLPFKSLDFWSPNSADAGLLDVFCLEDEPEIVAGQISPSAAPAPVLQAVLQSAYKKEIDTSIAIGSSGGNEANALGTAIAGYLKDHGPLTNRSDWVTHQDGSVNLSDVINAALVDPASRANKAYAESPVRALSQVSNTRTWNLLIDVIAQTGRFPRNATDLKQFTVEGEKRYWLHIAIDRYTGKLIDQQLEPIYE